MEDFKLIPQKLIRIPLKKKNTKKKTLQLLKIIPENKIIIVAFSGGESSAYALKLVIEKYLKTHKIKVCFCNTGEEDEETFLFAEKIRKYYNIEIVWLEYQKNRGFKIVDFNSAYRITEFEKSNEYPNHPFHLWVQDYGLAQYPERTCTREMKERTISRYLSSVGIFPRMCVRVVGIRFDEISNRNPHPSKYYPLILNGITKTYLNRFFEYDMPFRLNLESFLGNCGVCISKSLRNLCTIARLYPDKFAFFNFLNIKYGDGRHTFYQKYKTIEDVFEMAKDSKIKNAKDNRFELDYQQDLFFDLKLDSEGACNGTCEAFS